MCTTATRMDNPLGDAFVVEACDLLSEVEVFEEGRPTQAGFQRIVRMRYRHALVGGELGAWSAFTSKLEVGLLGVASRRARENAGNLDGCIAAGRDGFAGRFGIGGTRHRGDSVGASDG